MDMSLFSAAAACEGWLSSPAVPPAVQGLRWGGPAVIDSGTSDPTRPHLHLQGAALPCPAQVEIQTQFRVGLRDTALGTGPSFMNLSSTALCLPGVGQQQFPERSISQR